MMDTLFNFSLLRNFQCSVIKFFFAVLNRKFHLSAQ
jgi:hypothetical protein